MVEHLENPSAEDLDALTALWEASVRATHRFLAPDEIAFYRTLVRTRALPAAELFVIRTQDGEYAAFMGIDRDKIEMLFAAPCMRRQGLGSALVKHAVEECGVRRVDVNEQNAAAAAFYARMGFRILSREATDPSGKPHPILHLGL